MLLAEIGGGPLDALARREVFDPLGLQETRFCPPQRPRPHGGHGDEAPPGGTIVGTVHDEMAAAVGGVAGHAGLFSTCQDLERYCRMWLGGGRLDGAPFLLRGHRRRATRDPTGGAPDGEGARRRGLGWVLLPNSRWAGGGAVLAGCLRSYRVYRHLTVRRPPGGVFTVLLTNRVHPTRDGGDLEQVESLRPASTTPSRTALSQR